MRRRSRSNSRSVEEERRNREKNPRRGASNANANGDRGCSLLIRNFPSDTRAEDLRDAFKRFGLIRDVYLPRDRQTGLVREFGYVEYLEAKAASHAQYYMNNQVFRGNYITVRHATTSKFDCAEIGSSARIRYGSYRSYRGSRSRFCSYSWPRSPRDRDRPSRYGSYRNYRGSQSRSRSRSNPRPHSPRYQSRNSRYGRYQSYRGLRSRSLSNSRSRSPRHQDHQSRPYSPAPRCREKYSVSPHYARSPDKRGLERSPHHVDRVPHRGSRSRSSD